MNSHAQVPRLLHLDDRIRVYFACRSARDSSHQFVSRIGFVDLDSTNLSNVIGISPHPALDLGHIGQFDRFGVMPGCITHTDGNIYMYYTGWSRRTDVPYCTAIGVAISTDQGLKFRKAFNGPLLGITANEPLLCNGPWIFHDGKSMHMYYASAVNWIETDGSPECHYVIMHATSMDGFTWKRDGVACVPSAIDLECQNAPTVIRIADKFHMWFCYRRALDFRTSEHGYRIGHAWSDDLISWHRDDLNGSLPLSKDGWDSEMVCYPSVYRIADRVVLFYCGNAFGTAGFGWAELNMKD